MFPFSQDVLYVGDHIFGDILKSKKQHGWRWAIRMTLLGNDAVFPGRIWLYEKLTKIYRFSLTMQVGLGGVPGILIAVR